MNEAPEGQLLARIRRGESQCRNRPRLGQSDARPSTLPSPTKCSAGVADVDLSVSDHPSVSKLNKSNHYLVGIEIMIVEMNPEQDHQTVFDI